MDSTVVVMQLGIVIKKAATPASDVVHHCFFDADTDIVDADITYTDVDSTHADDADKMAPVMTMTRQRRGRRQKRMARRATQRRLTPISPC